MEYSKIFLIETKNECKIYYKDKLCTIVHREDGPAVEYKDGDKEWFINGEHHRIDGPAVERSNGYKAWYKNGMFHREDGPAIEEINGNKIYYINDKRFKTEEYWAIIRFGGFV